MERSAAVCLCHRELQQRPGRGRPVSRAAERMAAAAAPCSACAERAAAGALLSAWCTAADRRSCRVQWLSPQAQRPHGLCLHEDGSQRPCCG